MKTAFRGPGARIGGALILAVSLALACGGDGEGQDAALDSAPDLAQDVPVDNPPAEFAAETPAPDAPVDALSEDVPETTVSGCKSDCGTMVAVPGGGFQMGCSVAAPADCDADEKPSHAVTVAAFSVDKLEVTVALWTRCVADGACTTPNPSSSGCNWGIAGRETHPINCVQKAQAVAFCQWAGKRLCTEAEWEMAALGSDGRIYPWGNQPATCALAVLDEGGFGCGALTTSPVGSKPAGASPCGAMDMAGNVWEWVEDAYHDSYAGAPADGSAWELPAPSSSVARGGALSDKAPALRGSNRAPFDLALEGYYLGLRCCRSGTP